MTAPALADIVPVGHKYALRALDASVGPWTSPIELASGLHALSSFPSGLPDAWVEWVGKRELSIAQHCRLVFIATEPTAAAHVHDEQSKHLEEQLQRLYGALSIVTPGFHAPWGLGATGSHAEGRLSTSNHFQSVPYWSAPGTPKSWSVTPVHLRQAVDIANAMAAMRTGVDGKTDRLMRVFFAFHLGMSAPTWDVRAHQFCRVLDGLVATRQGHGKQDFRERCLVVIGDDDGRYAGFFERAYEVRGSVEHLRGPAAEIRRAMPELRSDNDAYLHLAYLAFVIEHVARHAMLHVCRTPRLWDPLRAHDSADALWRGGGATARDSWTEPLDLETIMRSFDGRRARSLLGLDG